MYDIKYYTRDPRNLPNPVSVIFFEIKKLYHVSLGVLPLLMRSRLECAF
jgi:hypothetical protein